MCVWMCISSFYLCSHPVSLATSHVLPKNISFFRIIKVKAESPGFDINDLGRMQSSDDIEYNADIQVRETMPGKFLQNWRLGFETRGAWNYEGVHQSNTWSQNTSLTLKNFWNFNLRTSFDLSTIDDALTRGGPYMGRPREFQIGRAHV